MAGPEAAGLARSWTADSPRAVGPVDKVVEVQAQQTPPSMAAGTNCSVVELASLVVEALVVLEVLVVDHEAEILHAGTASCPRLRGSRSRPCPQSLIQAECLL